MKKISLAWILSSIFFAGCVVNYRPVIDKNTLTEKGTTAIYADTVLFMVHDKIWTYEPSDLTDYYSAYYITVRNDGVENINIGREDFHLVDDEQNQSDAVSIEELLSHFAPNDEGYPDKFARSRIVPPFSENKVTNMEKRRNLQRYAFVFGDVLPKAKKSGFVFFPRQSSALKSYTLFFKDKSIKFQRVEKSIF